MSITAKLQNISIYKTEQKLMLYMLAKHKNSLVKLFMIADHAKDVYKLVRHDGMVRFQITMNKNVTSTYKNAPIPFYDVQKYEVISDDNRVTMNNYQEPPNYSHSIKDDPEWN